MGLPSCKTLLVDRDAEIVGDPFDVGDVEVDERVRTRVAFVLGEVEADLTARNRNEPRESWFELMLPFLLEAEPLVPGDNAHRVLDVQNRNDLFVNVATLLQLSSSSNAS